MTWRDDPPDDPNEGKVGYAQPPKATRFRKGESGNRAGRPKGSHRQAPYAAIFNQVVRIREDGLERLVTAAKAFLFYLKKEAVKDGGGPAARACMDLIEDAEKQFPDRSQVIAIIRVIVRLGSVTSALETLRMAKKLDPYRKTARVVLEPWLVEAALARLDRKLTLTEQRTVLAATRTPHKVRWPEWWNERP
jgi:hypothetical protein